MTRQEQKDELRKDLLARRRQLSRIQVTAASREIIRHCIDTIQWDEIKSLHAYVPITKRNEINTWPLLEYAWEHQPHVMTAVPMVREDVMHSVQVDDRTHWQENSYEIPEPQNGTYLGLDHLFSVVIVPVLGFDRRGHRLGYGKGYYDRFLHHQPNALTIGIAYTDAEIYPAIPDEPHDSRLHHIVTETKVIDSV